MQLEQTPNETKGLNPSIYHCTQCRHGQMMPTNQDAEPEYTDLFVCNNCQHQDNITAFTILCSQAMTSTFGLMVCVYLFINQLGYMIDNSNQNSADNTLSDMGLLALCAAFLFGFLYVLFRAFKGFKHRRTYLNLS